MLESYLKQYVPWLYSLPLCQLGLSIIGIILIFTVILSVFAKALLNLLISKTDKDHHDTLHRIIQALHLPLQFLIWFYAFVCIAEVGDRYFFRTHHPIFQDNWLGILFCLLLGWTFTRVLDAFESHFIQKAVNYGNSRRQSTANVRSLNKIGKIAVWIIFLIIILGLLNVPLSGLLTFGGVGGIGVALASKDLLANFAGGVMIFFNRHFSVGDWIYSPDRDIQGTVEYIGWRLTKIRSFDQRPIYVPNAIFNNVIIVNASKMSNRRIYQTISLRYDDADKVEDILNEIEAMLKIHPNIDQKNTILVNLDDKAAFGPSEINFIIYAFTTTTDWSSFKRVQDNVLLKVFAIIKKHDAAIAFPTRKILMNNQ